MKLTLHQPPKAMIGPSLLGVVGLIQFLFPVNTTTQIIGLTMVLATVAFWILALVHDPGPNAWIPSVPVRIILAVSSLAAGFALAALIR